MTVDYDYQDRTMGADQRAKDLLSRLSLREKIGQLNQTLYGFRCYEKTTDGIELKQDLLDAIDQWGGLGLLYGLFRTDPWTQKDNETGLNKREMVEIYNRVQKLVIDASRFSIPVLFSQESPHGAVQLDSYVLPVNLAVGATFNPELYREACHVVGAEMKASGNHLALVSMLDIVRDPRWGRSEEGFSEDPYLASKLCSAGVTGYLETGTQVVAKAYTVHGEGVGGIVAATVNIGEHDLQEIHLQPVRAVAEAGAVAVMASYNEINGVFCHADPYMLRYLLREQTGFKGFVMADGIAIDNLNLMTDDPVESAAAALRAGVDTSLWDHAFTQLEEAVERYPELEALVDEACERVLKVKFSSGLFDSPYLSHETVPDFPVSQYPSSLDLASDSIVLLKNENRVLPLSKKDSKSIALIGPHVRDVYTMCGDYTPYLNPDHCCSLQEAFEEVEVEEGCGIRERNPEALERAIALAEDADVVILTVGGSSSRFGESSFASNGALAGTIGDVDCGEGVDLANINISESQMELFREVRRLTHERGTPLITVVIAGRAYAIAEIAEQTDALLYSFYPGPMGGKAIHDVVFGRAPAGRLPVSLPNSNLNIPCYYNRKASYQARYSDMSAEPLYDFGYGLTYTEFRYEDATLSASSISEGDRLTLSVVIENTGDTDAVCIPQLFIRRTRSSRVPRVRELKAFSNHFIAAGEKVNIVLELNADDLKVWTPDREWKLEDGLLHLEIRDQGEIHWRGSIEIKS